MITEAQVRQAAEEAFGEYGWGYSYEPLVIDGVSYPIEWVEHTDHDDYSMNLEAVFKVNIDGWDRYFRKTGYNQSHVGETWDGTVTEVVPEPISRIEYKAGSTVEALTVDQVREAFGGDIYPYAVKKTETVNIGGRTYPVEFIELRDGGEGDYNIETYVIFRVGNQTFKKTGHYMSHYGDDWDGPITEVKPVEKTVTVWENV